MQVLNYKKTFFLNSYTKITDIKIFNGIEIAFIGYSNSGKSSAINVLTNKKKLARCSKTPGRTQLINFFQVVLNYRIVDLPGYGYAKAPILIRTKWQRNIWNYLEKRDQVKCLVLFMDIRYPLKNLDYKIIDMSLDKKIEILILLTKCDKLSINQQNTQLNIVSKKLYLLLDSFKIILFSSVKKIGIKSLQLQLNDWYDKYFFLNDVTY